MLGLLLLVALLVDLGRLIRRPVAAPDVRTELAAVTRGLQGPRYTDPQGRFSLVAPAGWQIIAPPNCQPYHVTFRSPNSADLNIMVTPVAYNDLPSLMREIEASERSAGIATHPEAFFFQGQPAVRRIAKLTQSKVLCVDFVREGLAHHVLASTPPEWFDLYYPVLLDVLKTYQPGPLSESVPAKADTTDKP